MVRGLGSKQVQLANQRTYSGKKVSAPKGPALNIYTNNTAAILQECLSIHKCKKGLANPASRKRKKRNNKKGKKVRESFLLNLMFFPQSVTMSTGCWTIKCQIYAGKVFF